MLIQSCSKQNTITDTKILGTSIITDTETNGDGSDVKKETAKQENQVHGTNLGAQILTPSHMDN